MGDGKPLPPISEDLVAELEAVSDALVERPDHSDLARRFEFLIDALILRGQLPKTFRRLIEKVNAARDGGRSVVRIAMFSDKYEVPSNDIDCAARIPLCGARCCSLEVSLSAQDVAERRLPFEIERPYILPKDPDTGRCGCMDADGACTVYEYRPGTCRAYDCRDDPRVWIDFDARIPAPPRPR